MASRYTQYRVLSSAGVGSVDRGYFGAAEPVYYVPDSAASRQRVGNTNLPADDYHRVDCLGRRRTKLVEQARGIRSPARRVLRSPRHRRAAPRRLASLRGCARRQQPRQTVAVRRERRNRLVCLRATLPSRLSLRAQPSSF